MAKFEIKKDNSGYYFWIMKSSLNGKTVAKSSESYNSKQGAKESIDWVKSNAKDAGITDLTY